MAILNPATDLDGIRWAILVTLTTDDLPDAVIQDDIYLANAEAWVIDIDPDAESRTGGELVRVKNAVKFYCAALLVPAVHQIVQRNIQLGQNNATTLRWKEFDPEERMEELKAKANAELNTLLGTTVIPFFRAIPSGRK